MGGDHRGLGIALGPIVGGLLLAHFWWGSVFLINVPIAALGFACAIPLVPDSQEPERRQPPDLAGALLSIAGSRPSAVGASSRRRSTAGPRAWCSPPGSAGSRCSALFALWERVDAHPMLDCGSSANR